MKSNSHPASWGIVVAAVGIVLGDIGTSPLYAFKESLRSANGATESHILGILSMILWLLILVVSVKYVYFVTRADNHGEGGTLSLLALLDRDANRPKIKVGALVLLALFGTALLYGDGIITPAISVLSAVEGMTVTYSSLEHWVVPITVVILIAVFSIQSKGTAKIGKIFGPVMVLWFAVIGILGLISVIKTPSVLAALNPYWALSYIQDHGWATMMTLGSVVLAVTGAEALYADMGHFGRIAINRAWHFFALPGLAFNYLGQGAVALRNPLSHENPFFALVPPGAGNIALVVLATAATIIASQAMISGVYSITQQAIQLGFFPRMQIMHTSETAFGQIYVPTINWMVGFSCILVVLYFQTSENLAAAYGIAVMGTMTVTSIVFSQVVLKCWKRPAWQAYGLMTLMLAIDLPLFFSNLHKIEEGGAFPLIVASLLLVVMHTWKVGRAAIAQELSRQGIEIGDFVKDVEESKPHRVRGTAVFMTGRNHGVPSTLLHHFKHNQVLHHNVILLTFATDSVPRVPNKDRTELKELGQGFWRATVHYGFMEEPRIIGAMDLINEASEGKLSFNPQRASYVFNREVIIGSGRSDLWRWQKALLGFLTRNAQQARDYFSVPTNQIVELATPIKL